MTITTILAADVVSAAATPTDKFTFDPVQRLVVVNNGVTSFTTTELYSRWKEWARADNNARFAQALSVVGGDPLGGGLFVASYFFLMNGWRVRPQEASHILTINGNLSTDDGGAPLVPTLGNFNVQTRLVVPVQAQGIATSGSAGPTADQVSAAVWTRILEAGLSAEAIIRLLASQAVGNATGLETTSVVFKSLDGTKTRIAGTVDGGTRTVTTRDGA